MSDNKKELINPIRKASPEELVRVAQYEDTIENLRSELSVLRKKIKPSDKPVEEREYIILHSLDGDSQHDYDVVIGRTAAYEAIKQYCISDPSYDVNTSTILVESRYPELRISVYEFMKKIEGDYPDNFDIEDYNNIDPDDVNDPDIDKSGKDIVKNIESELIQGFGNNQISSYDGVITGTTDDSESRDI